MPIRCCTVDEDGNIQPFFEYPEIENVITGAELLNKFMVVGAMCLYMYKAELLIKNNLRQIPGIFRGDEEFSTKCLAYTNRLSYRRHPVVYYYLQRPDSIINRRDIQHRKKFHTSLITVIDSISDIIRQKSSDTYLVKGLEKKKQQLLLSIFYQMYKEKINKDIFSEILELLKEKKYYPLNLSRLTYKQRVTGYLLRYKLFLYFLYPCLR